MFIPNIFKFAHGQNRQDDRTIYEHSDIAYRTCVFKNHFLGFRKPQNEYIERKIKMYFSKEYG